MNQEQIVKDFSELYIGQNPKQLTQQYLQKKKKEMFLIIIAAIVIVALCAFSDFQNSHIENNIIFRKDTDGTKAEIPLQIKIEDEKWKDIIVTLHPKEYSEDELEEMFVHACKDLADMIRMENADLKQVNSDLNLVQEVTGFPFTIRWESSKEQVINAEGKLIFEQEFLNESVELTAIFTYEDWEREYVLPVHVLANEPEDLMLSLEEDLKTRESSTREERQFHLPEIFENQFLQWRYPPGNSSIILGILFLFMIPFISYQKDQEIHKQAKERNTQLQDSFPEFISKLLLLMESGMSIRGAFFRIGEDYQKKRQFEKNYLYEEVLYICRQMKNGMMEREGYELLGKRCGLACYKKLSGLLIQHLQKGGSNILETLRGESAKAMEEQKRELQKKGEEMGTKLLFPMIMMLGIVMVFIMVPALYSFQM